MVSSLLPTVCLQSAEGISSEHLGFWTVACRLLLQILFIPFDFKDQSYIHIGKFQGQAGPPQVDVSRH